MSGHEFLTPLQSEAVANRMAHDSALILGGAAVDTTGGVWPTEAQESAMHQCMENALTKQRYERFIEETPEGQQIQDMIRGIGNALSEYYDGARSDRWLDAQLRELGNGPNDAGHRRYYQNQRQRQIDDARTFFQTYDELELPDEYRPTMQPFTSPSDLQLLSNDGKYRDILVKGLESLAKSLAENPRYKFGQHVQVEGDHTRINWEVERFTVNAGVRLRNESGEVLDVTLIDLDAWNTTPSSIIT